MAKNNQSNVSETDTIKTTAETENTAEKTGETPETNTGSGTAPQTGATPETPTAPQTGTTPETPPEPPTNKPRFEGVTNFIYAGPSLPRGQLQKYALLSGTFEEITAYHKEAVAICPSVARLIVPAARFAETRDKTQVSGNVLYNYYQEIAAAIKAKGVEQ